MEQYFEIGDLVELLDLSYGVVLDVVEKKHNTDSEEMYKIMYDNGDWGIYFCGELKRLKQIIV